MANIAGELSQEKSAWAIGGMVGVMVRLGQSCREGAAKEWMILA
jgi:hypothetical protein